MPDYEALCEGYLTVWNETDAAARAQAAGALFAEDVTDTDPLADVRGRDGLQAVVQGVQQQFPGWRFRRAGRCDGHGTQLRFGWELGPEGAPAPVAGFDVAVSTTTGASGRSWGSWTGCRADQAAGP